jgi:hypothetical protein
MAAQQVQKEEPFSMDKLNWVLDKWVGEGNGGTMYESWVKTDDNLFKGDAYTIRNGDTVFTESLKIEKVGDDIFYVATVAHNPGPVSFKLVGLSDNEAVFENPEHDFPNRIIYTLRDDGSLYARIEGKNKKGVEKIGEFFFKKAR